MRFTASDDTVCVFGSEIPRLHALALILIRNLLRSFLLSLTFMLFRCCFGRPPVLRRSAVLQGIARPKMQAVNCITESACHYPDGHIQSDKIPSRERNETATARIYELRRQIISVRWLHSDRSWLTFQRCLLPPRGQQAQHLWNVGKILPSHTVQLPRRETVPQVGRQSETCVSLYCKALYKKIWSRSQITGQFRRLLFHASDCTPGASRINLSNSFLVTLNLFCIRPYIRLTLNY
jgi:hypothetical protein